MNNQDLCTVQMVCHNIDHRHITARKFPSTWLVNRGTDINHEKVVKLFGKFGPVVAYEDHSEIELRADEFVIIEMIIGVEYLKVGDALRAIQTLDGVDNRTQSEKAREPVPRVENLFSCRMTGSPVQYSECECDANNCAASWQLEWVMPANQLLAPYLPRPPPYPPPAHLRRGVRGVWKLLEEQML